MIERGASMLTAVLLILMLAAFAAGFFECSWSDISAAAVCSCSNAVQLGIYLAGAMALWCGLMRVAEKSGLTGAVAKALALPVRLIFGKLDDEARQAVSLDLTANLLGLGNASTPAGIAAIRKLGKGPRPCRNIAVLTVLNTASIQLFPVTVAALRSAHGSAAPFDILPAVLLTSLCSAAVGCVTAAILYSGVDKCI